MRFLKLFEVRSKMRYISHCDVMYCCVLGLISLAFINNFFLFFRYSTHQIFQEEL